MLDLTNLGRYKLAGEHKRKQGMTTNRGKLLLRKGVFQKLAKFTTFFVAIWVGLAPGALVHADTDLQWTDACVAGIKATGGRGSNAPVAYCACMSKAAKQFQGDASGLLAVMRSPVATKMTAFQSQKETNKKIISACVRRIEEVYGLVAKRSATEARVPSGIWADRGVIEAIRSINFSSSQAKVFKRAATDLSNDLRKATAKILRDDSDTRRRVKKTQRKLLNRMDKKVSVVLESNQLSRYQVFSALLLEKIRASTRSGSGDFLDTSGIPGGHAH